MSLLEQASLVITPNAYKESVLYSVVPNTTLGDMDVVRATTATRVNSAGLIESVGVNVPRIDYTNGSCPSLLVEPQRTNRLLNSEIVATQTITTTAVATTVSFYGTGTITFTGSYVGSLVGTGVNNRVSLTFTPTVGSLILTVVGSCAKGQLEAGSYATSYIPTVATSVTRNADVISNSNINNFVGNNQGTFVYDFQGYTQGSSVGQPYWGYLSDGSKELFFYDSGIYTTINASFQFIANLPSGTIPFKVAYRWNASFISIFINGIKIIDFAKTAAFNPTYFTPTSNSNVSKQIYNNIIGFNIGLTDAECLQLTTL